MSDLGDASSGELKIDYAHRVMLGGLSEQLASGDKRYALDLLMNAARHTHDGVRFGDFVSVIALTRDLNADIKLDHLLALLERPIHVDFVETPYRMNWEFELFELPDDPAFDGGSRVVPVPPRRALHPEIVRELKERRQIVLDVLREQTGAIPGAPQAIARWAVDKVNAHAGDRWFFQSAYLDTREIPIEDRLRQVREWWSDAAGQAGGRPAEALERNRLLTHLVVHVERATVATVIAWLEMMEDEEVNRITLGYLSRARASLERDS